MKILITGGKSDIGMAIARRQLALGHEITVTSSTAESLKETRESYASQGIRASFLQFDLDPDKPYSPELEKLIADGFDAVVLNAATRLPELKLFHELSPSEMGSYVTPNILGNMALLQKILPGMMDRNFGRIVFISSIAAIAGTSRYNVYSVAKSGMEGLIYNLAVDYGKYNVLSNIVRPGIIKSDRTRRYWEREGYVARATRIIPQNTLGEPSQVAEAVDPLLSPTSYMNGSVLTVSGGLPLVRSERL